MDPPLFYWAPSGDASLLTLRISRSLFPNMAIATEVIMTDQCIVSYVAAICQLHMRRCTRAQSDKRDIVSNDSDGTEHGAPDAVAGVVCPLRVRSVSESKRMRRPWAVLAKDALRLGRRLLGGVARRAWSLKGGYRNRPGDRRKPVPAFIAGLWIEDCDKKGIQKIYSLT
jgi:hypothetical protein